MRERRSRAELDAAGEAIADHGVAAWRHMQCVAAYAGIGAEPPTQALLDRLTDAGVRVLLPIIDGDRLHWAAYRGWESLRPDRLGIPQPVVAEHEQLTSADVVVAPALAVDRAGHRLGRGGGYYDRALVDVDPSVVVAVVFDEEVVDELPVEPHDRPVGAVLTPFAGLRRLP